MRAARAPRAATSGAATCRKPGAARPLADAQKPARHARCSAGLRHAFLAAAQLFELGRLSAGRAAVLAGMSRPDFTSALDRVGVAAINVRDEDVEAEVQAARELAG
jgi:hypothetical protein